MLLNLLGQPLLLMRTSLVIVSINNYYFLFGLKGTLIGPLRDLLQEIDCTLSAILNFIPCKGACLGFSLCCPWRGSGNRSYSQNRGGGGSARGCFAFGASKTRTLRQKVRQKHLPLSKKSAMDPSELGHSQRGAKPLPVPASSL